MKMTKGKINDSMDALVTIGNRPHTHIPTIAKARLARMHDALRPIFELIAESQQDLVVKYGEEQFLDAEKTKSSGQWAITDPEKMKAYKAEWKTICEESVDVNVNPAPLAMFGDDPNGLEMKDIVLLGPLVAHPTED